MNLLEKINDIKENFLTNDDSFVTDMDRMGRLATYAVQQKEESNKQVEHQADRVRELQALIRALEAQETLKNQKLKELEESSAQYIKETEQKEAKLQARIRELSQARIRELSYESSVVVDVKDVDKTFLHDLQRASGIEDADRKILFSLFSSVSHTNKDAQVTMAQPNLATWGCGCRCSLDTYGEILPSTLNFHHFKPWKQASIIVDLGAGRGDAAVQMLVTHPSSKVQIHAYELVKERFDVMVAMAGKLMTFKGWEGKVQEKKDGSIIYSFENGKILILHHDNGLSHPNPESVDFFLFDVAIPKCGTNRGAWAKFFARATKPGCVVFSYMHADDMSTELPDDKWDIEYASVPTTWNTSAVFCVFTKN